jgi:hypothetical protein
MLKPSDITVRLFTQAVKPQPGNTVSKELNGLRDSG